MIVLTMDNPTLTSPKQWRQTICITIDPLVLEHIDRLRGDINRSRYIEAALILHIQDMATLVDEEPIENLPQIDFDSL